MKASLEADSNVRFVLKEFPILGPDSLDASHVSLAFREVAPDKYRQFFNALLGGSEHADADRAFAVAKSLGVDRQTLEAKMKDPAIKAEISNAYALANDLGVTGTPAYVLGDEAVSGALGAQVLLQKIANVRKCGSTAC
ncbi:MAG: DsbA family protein [Pararhizobium sp.]